MNVLAQHIAQQQAHARLQVKSWTRRVCLHTASRPVLWVACGGFPAGRPAYGDCCGRAGVGAFLTALQLWLRAWLAALTGRGYEEGAEIAPQNTGGNRRARRLNWNKIPSIHNLSLYWRILPKSLSRGQFIARVAQISPLGRLAIYNISSVGTVLVRRALLVCYDHGWWRAPLGDFGRVRHGFWQAHLWPDWCGQINFSMTELGKN